MIETVQFAFNYSKPRREEESDSVAADNDDGGQPEASKRQRTRSASPTSRSVAMREDLLPFDGGLFKQQQLEALHASNNGGPFSRYELLLEYKNLSHFPYDEDLRGIYVMPSEDNIYSKL